MPTLPNTSNEDKSRIQSIEKMMRILSCFSTVSRHLSLGQIAAETGMPRPTAYRMLSALRGIGFITQDARNSSYSLGIRLFQLGSLTLANLDLLREAKPYLDRLVRLSGESAHLGVFNGFEVTVVEREDPLDRPLRGVNVLQSESSPTYCTGVGKALLAFQTSEDIERVIAVGLEAFTTNTIISPDALRSELSEVRKRGYAVDNSEHQLWTNCVAAPIRNASGHVFASVSVTGPADRMPPERLEQLAPVVVQAADMIARQLGYEEGSAIEPS